MRPSAVFWVAFGVFTDTWYGETPVGGPLDMDKLIVLAGELVGFPNVLEEVVKPWGKVIPLLSVALFVALSALASSRKPAPPKLRTSGAVFWPGARPAYRSTRWVRARRSQQLVR